MDKSPGLLHFVGDSKTQQQYLKVLNDGLLLFKQRMEANSDSTIIMQGNVPCHAAKSVKDFFQSKRRNSFLTTQVA